MIAAHKHSLAQREAPARQVQCPAEAAWMACGKRQRSRIADCGSGALHFEYFNARGELASRCLHARRPVVQEGERLATTWLRQGPLLR